MAGAAISIHDAAGKMSRLCRKIFHVNIRWSILDKVSAFRQFFRIIWDRILVCSIGRPIRYRRLSQRSCNSSSSSVEAIESCIGHEEDPVTITCSSSSSYEDTNDSDLVALKISLLGDCQIGKTSFMV